MDEILFGLINPQLTAAGCLGGLLHALRADKAETPWQIISYIVSGGIAANFLAPQALHILAIFPAHFIAFGIGTSGKFWSWVIEMFFYKLGMSGKIENE